MCFTIKIKVGLNVYKSSRRPVYVSDRHPLPVHSSTYDKTVSSLKRTRKKRFTSLLKQEMGEERDGNRDEAGVNKV